MYILYEVCFSCEKENPIYLFKVKTWEEFYKKLMLNLEDYILIDITEKEIFTYFDEIKSFFNLGSISDGKISNKEFVKKYVDLNKWKEFKNVLDKLQIEDQVWLKIRELDIEE